ncbi:MAG: penicillin-binding protein [Bacteroidales bacterium]|nr:penicillin-binding protein [Bacteroidales bacterium]
MTDQKKDILWRVYLVYFGILVFGVAIIAKMLYIQIAEGEELKQKAQHQELTVANLEASRGNILASDGSLLATSVPIFEIRFDVASPHIPDELFYGKIDSLAKGLANTFNRASQWQIKNDLIKARKSGKRYHLLSRAATYDQLKELRGLPILRRGKYRGGLITIQKTKRVRPFKELAGRTIGYEIKEENLFVGLEGAFSDVLTGEDGKMVLRRINHGDWVPIHDENEVEPKNGLDIVTTIDVNIQDVTELALLRQLINNEAFQGCAVVMEVATGHIKAIANLRYDSTDHFYKETYNYAIGESIEPGSTFKLYSLMTALEDHKVKLTDSVITGEGYTSYYGRPLKDVHKIKNGRVTVRDVFEHSSNVGVSRIINEAYKEDPNQFIEGLYDLGLNVPLGLEIQGEGKPYIKHPSDKKTWYGTSLPWMSIGYELTITPLQNLTLYNAVANNGIKVKPMFVTEIKEAGIQKKIFSTEVIDKKIASEETIQLAQSLLEGVVENGTGKSTFASSPYKVAGKTGTAQIAVGGQYNKTNYNASFIGYFPADNPKYSCIVVINNPSAGKYYGGSVAAPAFKEIADKIYATSLALELDHLEDTNTLHIIQANKAVWYTDLKHIYNELDHKHEDFIYEEKWAYAEVNDESIELKPKFFPEEVTPNVVGMKAKDAVYLLENLGYQATINGKGKVRSQSVRSGTPVTKGRQINLQLSSY